MFAVKVEQIVFRQINLKRKNTAVSVIKVTEFWQGGCRKSNIMVWQGSVSFHFIATLVFLHFVSSLIRHQIHPAEQNHIFNEHYKASIPLEVAGVILVALRVLERLNLV